MTILSAQYNLQYGKHNISKLKKVPAFHQSMSCVKLGTHCSCFNNCTAPGANWPFRAAMSIKSSGSLYSNIDDCEKECYSTFYANHIWGFKRLHMHIHQYDICQGDAYQRPYLKWYHWVLTMPYNDIYLGQQVMVCCLMAPYAKFWNISNGSGQISIKPLSDVVMT